MSYTEQVLNQAAAALQEGRKAEAWKLVAPITQAEPDNARAWSLLADIAQDRAPDQAASYRQKAEAARAKTMARPATPPAPPPMQQQYGPPQQLRPMGPPQAYQQPPPAWTQQKPRSRVARLITAVLILGGIALVILVGPGLLKNSSRTPIYAPSSGGIRSTVNVLYEVTGTSCCASLTYQNASGGTEQTDVRLPWKHSMSVPAGTFVYLSAQNDSELGGVTCTIRVAGQVYKTSTSTGAYKIASCSGSAER